MVSNASRVAAFKIT